MVSVASAQTGRSAAGVAAIPEHVAGSAAGHSAAASAPVERGTGGWRCGGSAHSRGRYSALGAGSGSLTGSQASLLQQQLLQQQRTAAERAASRGESRFQARRHRLGLSDHTFSAICDECPANWLRLPRHRLITPDSKRRRLVAERGAARAADGSEQHNHPEPHRRRPSRQSKSCRPASVRSSRISSISSRATIPISSTVTESCCWPVFRRLPWMA